MFFDEVAAGFDFVAHEDAEDVVGVGDVVHFDFDEGAVGGIERGFAELFGVHFAEAFEAGDVKALLTHLANGRGEAAEVFGSEHSLAKDADTYREDVLASFRQEVGPEPAGVAELRARGDDLRKRFAEEAARAHARDRLDGPGDERKRQILEGQQYLDLGRLATIQLLPHGVYGSLQNQLASIGTCKTFDESKLTSSVICPECGYRPRPSAGPTARAAIDGIAGEIDPAREVLPVSGSREGLFFAAIPAAGRKPVQGRPAILIVNPFYQAYLGAALATNCEPVFLNATAETGHLPDLAALEREPELLARAVALYLCSPANPQGAVADAAYIRAALGLARRHDIMLFFDECYSEIYSAEPPAGMLQAAGADFSNVVVFHSLSKRSSLPGLRVGFAAGDAAFMKLFLDLRAVAAPQVPIPAQEVAVAAYGDEQHVEANRALYRAKFDLADQIIGNRYGYRRPPGGFFLWLDVAAQGGDEAATLKLWTEAGLRVLPGSYAARPQANGFNPGDGYIRIAMVQDRETTAEALHRLVTVLG